jgi:hypothetical protein
MTIFDQDHSLPEPGPGDRGLAVLRSVLGTLPVVSQAAQELLNYIVTPPLVQRQREWMNDIAESLRRLEVARGVTPDQLRDNPAFVDAVLTGDASGDPNKSGREEGSTA